MSRQMLSFPFGGQRFNYRVAAIAIVDNPVLVCDEDEDGYAMLPGGRVELGEASRVALEREILEEVGLSAIVGQLRLTSESFYRREGENFHELCLFYAADFGPDVGPDGHSPWRVTRDDGSEHRFHWLDLGGDGMARLNLMPVWLRSMLPALPASLTHIIHDERAP